jgi:DNA-binding response OmpR family regulator
MQPTFARVEPMIRDVARVLICEPHPEVRELLRRVVVRLGHEPMLEDAALQQVDAILLEPAHAPSVERARAFRAADDHTPIVCTSTELPDTGSRRLSPIAYLVKPFALPDLEHAITRALSTRNGNGTSPRA